MIPSFKLFKKIGEIYTNIVPYYSALLLVSITQMEFLIEDFSSKCDQIRSFLQIWSHLLEKSLMENFIFLSSDHWR